MNNNNPGYKCCCPKCNEELEFIPGELDKSEFWGVVLLRTIPDAWYCDTCEKDIKEDEVVTN